MTTAVSCVSGFLEVASDGLALPPDKVGYLMLVGGTIGLAVTFIYSNDVQTILSGAVIGAIALPILAALALELKRRRIQSRLSAFPTEKVFKSTFFIFGSLSLLRKKRKEEDNTPFSHSELVWDITKTKYHGDLHYRLPFDSIESPADEDNSAEINKTRILETLSRPIKDWYQGVISREDLNARIKDATSWLDLRISKERNADGFYSPQISWKNGILSQLYAQQYEEWSNQKEVMGPDARSQQYISENVFAVALITAENSWPPHAQIAIEGLRYNREKAKRERFIIIAHLQGEKCAGNSCSTRAKPGIGYLPPEILRYQEIAGVWSRSREAVKQMLQNVKREKEAPVSSFSMVPLTEYQENCLAFARRHLRSLGIELSQKRGYLPHFHPHAYTQEKPSSSCVLM